MKKTRLLLLFHFFTAFAVAQTNVTDSLKRVLENEKNDTTRVFMLEELSRIYSTSKTDTSLLLAQQALSLARKHGFEKGEAASLNRIGTVLSSIGNHPLALENLLEALRINEKIKNQDGIMRNLGNIANVNAELGEYREGLTYSFREKRSAEKMADEERLTNTLLRIGDIYEKLDMLDSARIFTEQAYSHAVSMNIDYYYTSIAFNNLGNVYSKLYKKDPAMYPLSMAMNFYRSSLDLYEKNDDDEGTAESTLGIARLFNTTNQNDSALYYAKLSLDAAERGGFTIYTLDASQFLSDHYEAKNKLDSAFHYQKITIAAKDSLFSQEKIIRVQSLSFEERKRQQQLEEERIKTELERKNNIQLMGIATVIVALFLLLLLISRRETKARTVEVYGLISLLFLFEFVYLLIHPYIEEWTNHTPVLMLLILVGVAAVLIPVHQRLEKWVNEKLAHKIRSAPKPVAAGPQPGSQKIDSEITP